MRSTSFRVVLDTDVIVRGFVNPRSESGRILSACEQRVVVPLLSRVLLGEYRAVLANEQVTARFPQLRRPQVAIALQRRAYVADSYRRLTAQFDYPRDPGDEHLIELSLTGASTHLITTDNDLLSLPHGRDAAARRFRQRMPGLAILPPSLFVRLVPNSSPGS